MSAPLPAGLAPLVPLWRASLASAGRSPRTIRTYTGHLAAFARTLPADADLMTITPARIETWRGRLPGKPRSIGLALTSVRSFCRWAVRCELRADDPTLRVEYPHLGRRLPGRALTARQLATLADALRRDEPDWTRAERFWHRRNRLACYLMLYAGLRLSEASRLRWDDVILDEHPRLTVRGGKGAVDRTIPLHQVLEVELHRAWGERHRRQSTVLARSDGEPMSAKGLGKIFDRWAHGLGLEIHFTAHQLRHSFCTGLVLAKAPLFDVQELMGHADPKTTRGYYTLVAEHLRGTVALLPSY